jgi:uncharacterized repeat protein (TIGR02543 family)
VLPHGLLGAAARAVRACDAALCPIYRGFMKVLYALFAFILLLGCSSSDNSDETTIPIPDITSYMVWFDANGGEFADGETIKPEIIIALYGEQQVPTKKDFQFSHWNSKQDGSGINITFINSSSYGFKENVTMYAQWTPLDGDYNVVFEARMPSDLKIIKNLAADYVINLPDKSEYTMKDYTLLGWVDPETSTLYTDTYQVKKTVTLFAVWERDVLPDKCSLVLYAMDDGWIPSHRSRVAVNVYSCGLINLRDLPKVEMAGHVLKGWRSSLYNKNGGFFHPYLGQYKLETRAVLYAVWEKE